MTSHRYRVHILRLGNGITARTQTPALALQQQGIRLKSKLSSRLTTVFIEARRVFRTVARIATAYSPLRYE